MFHNFKIHRWKPTNEWRTQFQNYMRTLPAYYAGPLRRAITRMGKLVCMNDFKYFETNILL